MDRFERSLRFFYLKFDKEAIFDGFMAHSRIFRGGVGGGGKEILINFRELNFCGPRVPCFSLFLTFDTDK